ncbi:MAG: hypothetical protein HYZ81_15925 [Nitrospinae bacterium]|nr:hypothetical protein [Nitrospinota bacterium]
MRPRRCGLILLVVCSLLAGKLVLAREVVGAVQPAPSLSLSVNQTSFQGGDTLRVGLTAQNIGPAFLADFYFGVLLPIEGTLFFITSLSPPTGVVSRLDSPQTFQPLLANFPLPQGLEFAKSDVFVLPVSGAEPPGTYVFFAALTPPGAFIDGGSDAGDILAIATTSFSFSAAGARLIPLSGNNQMGQPGEVLPEPLVVRLENQFGPLVGEMVRAEIVQGEGELLRSAISTSQALERSSLAVQASASLTVATDARGEAAFHLRVIGSAESIAVKVSAPALPNVSPVEFLVILGVVDPRAIAIEANGTLVVVDCVFRAVVRVDPRQGSATLVSGGGIGRGPLFRSPQGIAVEADGSLVVVDARSDTPAVVRVNPRTGDRTILSNATTGSGPSFASPVGIAVEADGQLLVVDARADAPAMVRVDPGTGDRTIVSGCTDFDLTTRQCKAARGSGPTLASPVGIAVEADGRLVVTNRTVDFGAVVRVDPRTGDRTILSDATTGGGPPFASPRGIAVEADGQLVVVDGDFDAVVRVDPRTGDRKILSDATIGSGPRFDFPRGIAVEADGRLVVTDGLCGLQAVVRVDPPTGDRKLVTQPGTGRGSGPPFQVLAGVAMEADGRLVVVDGGLDAVVRVDPRTGDRAILSDTTTGRGPPFAFPLGIAGEADGQLVVVDGELAAVVRVDPRTGDRAILSGCTNRNPDTFNCTASRGGGPFFVFPLSIAVEGDGRLVVVDARSDAPAVLRMDPRTGDRAIVSNNTTGIGRSFALPWGIAVEADGRLVVVDRNLRAVVRVDPRTGDRAIVSDATTGRGPPFTSPVGVAVEADGRLVVVDRDLQAVVRVDPRTGDRAIVSDDTTSIGLPLVAPLGIAVEADGRLVVTDNIFNFGVVVRVDPSRGDRTIVSVKRP